MYYPYIMTIGWDGTGLVTCIYILCMCSTSSRLQKVAPLVMGWGQLFIIKIISDCKK